MPEDLIRLNELLLGSGANINEINTVRRHVSKVKGGQLLRHIYPAKCVSLIISDVLGDEPESIASGPTAADDTTFRDARDVIERYNLSERIPSSVLIHLQSGTEGKINETVKSDDPILKSIQNVILGNIDLAIEAASDTAKQQGFEVISDFDLMKGEAKEMGEYISLMMLRYKENANCEKPLCLVFGGETTVTLSSGGKGGRSTELALSALINLSDFKGSFALLSAGTDGTDGPTDAAGAVISNDTFVKIKKLQLEPEAYLQKHDSYHFFEKTGDLLKTGPTGTNVNDLVVALIE
jgi:glycerate-2-kinase